MLGKWPLASGLWLLASVVQQLLAAPFQGAVLHRGQYPVPEGPRWLSLAAAVTRTARGHFRRGISSAAPGQLPVEDISTQPLAAWAARFNLERSIWQKGVHERAMPLRD